MAILEERKQELVGLITKEQDEKLKHVQSLIRQHSDHLEVGVTLVESGIQSMEEPHMPLFIQVGKNCSFTKRFLVFPDLIKYDSTVFLTVHLLILQM